ncbi:hypothetical protein M758_7G053500 [Ceratodon purpureus]|nr:hypothetical protein M758_7G053500 [Ceratodon purpureus]
MARAVRVCNPGLSFSSTLYASRSTLLPAMATAGMLRCCCATTQPPPLPLPGTIAHAPRPWATPLRHGFHTKPLSLLGLQSPATSLLTGRISALNGRGLRSVYPCRSVTRAMARDSDSEIQRAKSNERGSLSHLELESSGDTKRKASFNGIFTLLLINFVAFAADHWLQLPFMRSLYLYHDYPRWYQFVTSTFIHASWAHLSSNLFFLYIFGKLVEEEEGSFAVWLSYLFTGVGANLVSWLILPRTVVSVGASGAVFGLFAISVLVKLSFDWRKILEVLILGQFVVEKVMEAAQASTQLAGRTYMGAANINHIAHLSGALVGVALIWMLNGITHLADKSSRK